MKFQIVEANGQFSATVNDLYLGQDSALYVERINPKNTKYEAAKELLMFSVRKRLQVKEAIGLAAEAYAELLEDLKKASLAIDNVYYDIDQAKYESNKRKERDKLEPLQQTMRTLIESL